MEANVRDLAEFSRLGTRFQILAPASIVEWADSLIAAGDIPDPWLIDLSLATTADAMDDALRRVPGEAQGDLAVRLFLALVLRRWRSGQLDIGDVRGIGWYLYSELALLTPSVEAYWGIELEAECDAFEEGWVAEDELRRSIDEKLSRYSCLESMLPNWA